VAGIHHKLCFIYIYVYIYMHLMCLCSVLCVLEGRSSDLDPNSGFAG
jgi:hypothetical protein